MAKKRAALPAGPGPGIKTMAEGHPLMTASPEDRLRWLLDFARQDLDTLRPGALLDLGGDVLAFPHTGAVTFVIPDLARVEVDFSQPRPTTRATLDLMRQLQADLRDGLRCLQDMREWRLPAAPPQWFVGYWGDGSQRLTTRYIGTVRETFLAVAADLLKQGWPLLRRCQNPACAVFFLPTHGRQTYHAPSCSQQVRASRLPKDYWKHRKRNYSAEYSRRLAKKYGKDPRPKKVTRRESRAGRR